jgi:hypothetical protein
LEKLPDFDLVKRYPMDALFENKVAARERTRTIYPTIQI